MNDLLVKNGTVFNSGGSSKLDILVKNGIIVDIGENLDHVGSSVEVVDAENMYVLPGVIDSQVHFREPGLTHKEDLESGSKSAVLGGITTFLEMPNTSPSTTSQVRIQEKVQIAKSKSYSNFGFFMGATGQNIDELKKVADTEGCCGIKIFLGSSTGSLLLYDEDKLTEVFTETDVPIAIHSENEEMLNARKAIRDSATTAHSHPEWRSEEVAFSSTKMVVNLAERAERKIHVLHISTKKEIEYLREHKKYVSVEVLPQHLTLHAPDCYDNLGTFAQMNPPIREIEHQQALWAGIENGTVDVIGSDHAPHTREEKEKGYPSSPSGMPGVQTILPVMLDHVANGKLTLEKLVELMCETPANMYNLNKGYIKKGFDGDLTIVDPLKSVVLSHSSMATKSGWTPFDGKKVKGFPVYTIVGGRVVMKHGKIVSEPCGKPISKRT